MGKNGESPQSSGLLARLSRIVKRASAGEGEAAVELEPAQDELSGPSGLPAAPLRVEKRGL